eukprot:Ihof_evm3s308 gene=Ihof_evmTU3s308
MRFSVCVAVALCVSLVFADAGADQSQPPVEEPMEFVEANVIPEANPGETVINAELKQNDQFSFDWLIKQQQDMFRMIGDVLSAGVKDTLDLASHTDLNVKKISSDVTNVVKGAISSKLGDVTSMFDLSGWRAAPGTLACTIVLLAICLTYHSNYFPSGEKAMQWGCLHLLLMFILSIIEVPTFDHPVGDALFVFCILANMITLILLITSMSMKGGQLAAVVVASVTLLLSMEEVQSLMENSERRIGSGVGLGLFFIDLVALVMIVVQEPTRVISTPSHTHHTPTVTPRARIYSSSSSPATDAIKTPRMT